MAGKANPSIVADRYAQALLELALAQKLEGDVASDLKALSAAIKGSFDLRRNLASPLLSKVEASALVKALLTKLKASPLTHNFLQRLVLNQRLGLIALIETQYEKMLYAHRGDVKVEVTLARKLDEKAEAELVSVLKKTVGTKIETKIQEDPSLLGGMIIKIGSKMLDVSAKSRIERMRLAMKGV